jgi:hypothetical protein
MYFNKFADYTEEYFSLLIQHPWDIYDREAICCTIRLIAVDDKNVKAGKRGIYFCTVGRSKSHNPSARRISTPIKNDSGIYKLFAQKNNQGVIICDDIPSAIRYEYYKEAKDRQRSDNKQISFIMAPINGFINGKIQIVGSLTVTSRKKTKVFKKSHVDILRAMADILGAVSPYTCKKLFPETGNGLIPMPADDTNNDTTS